MIPEDFKNLDEELKAIAPSLKKLDKPVYSDVPEGYFEHLPEQIWNKIQASEANIAKPKRSVFQFIRPQFIAVAASFVIMVATIFTIRTAADSPSELVLTTEELLAYMLDSNEEFEEELFYSLIEEEDLTNVSFSTEEELDYYLEENINELDDSVLEEIF